MEDLLMNEQFLEEKGKLLAQFEKGLNVVLSTSHKDFVTSRTVTIISFKDALYLTSIRRPGAIKIEQIEKNPNVAICFNATQITGTAAIIGLVSAEQNTEIKTLYKEKLPQAFERFAAAPSAVFIKIDVSSCKSWKMADNHVETTAIDFINQTIEKNTI
jgi:general stress protein 26